MRTLAAFCITWAIYPVFHAVTDIPFPWALIWTVPLTVGVLSLVDTDD